MSDETMIDGGQGASDQTEAPTTEDTGNWMDSIPEDLRGDTSLADIKDVAGLAKGYVHAQKMIGADKVVLPAPDASQEDMDAFYNKLGRPEKADGYEVPTENMPAEVPVNGELVGKFFEEAHRIGLNKQQAAAIIRWQTTLQQEQMGVYEQQNTEALQTAEATMRKEFGNAYDEKISMAQGAVMRFGGDELVKMLNDTGLGNSPEIIRAFSNIAKAISNDEVIGGGGRQTFMSSPSEAKSTIANKRRDPDFMAAYQDAMHIGHKDAVEEMGRLFENAYPVEE